MAFSVVVVVAVTALALVPQRHGVVAIADVAMLYLGAIVIVALRSGKLASVVSAVLSVAAFNFFYVEPWYTFAVAQSRHLITFATMCIVGLTLSSLAHRLRERDAEHSRLVDEARELELLRRTDDMRRSLLSAVSHDLRTPLGTITGAATTLRDDGERLLPAERGLLLDDIATEAFRLEWLVGSLLDMSRVDAGALVLRRAWLPIEEIIGPALSRVESRLHPRTVSIDIAPDVPFVFVDPVTMEQVLVNLLENVARHTPASASVTIVAAHRGPPGGGTVELVVHDTGPGLPEGLDVFARFVRGGAGGIGLGLSIVRGLVEAHGGTVTASNDRGCVVKVSLPGGAAPRAEAPVGAEVT